jgi:hypothetical protein
LDIAKKNKISAKIIGKVGGKKLVINDLVNLSVDELSNTWRTAIEKEYSG